MADKKTERYKRILKQIENLIEGKKDVTARMATINAVLVHKMADFFWVGYYLLKDGILTVGPYQGPIACLELEKGKGVCWACIRYKKTLIVPDVDKFSGHIACDSRSKSEIVVPLHNKLGKIVGVFDIDSRKKSCFDETDATYLERVASMVYNTE